MTCSYSTGIPNDGAVGFKRSLAELIAGIASEIVTRLRSEQITTHDLLDAIDARISMVDSLVHHCLRCVSIKHLQMLIRFPEMES